MAGKYASHEADYSTRENKR